MLALRGPFPRSKRKDEERWVVIGDYLPALLSCPRISKTPFGPVGVGQIVPKTDREAWGQMCLRKNASFALNPSLLLPCECWVWS